MWPNGTNIIKPLCDKRPLCKLPNIILHNNLIMTYVTKVYSHHIRNAQTSLSASCINSNDILCFNSNMKHFEIKKSDHEKVHHPIF